MPMHDWTRAEFAVFHAFHNTWIAELQKALNDRVLPPEYYALGEQRAGDIAPDVLTLQADEDPCQANGWSRSSDASRRGMVALAETPPCVRITQEAEDLTFYLARQRSIMIRQASGDRVVAMIEIVSPGNKHGQRDPDGIHGVIWDRLLAGSYQAPEGDPLTLVSYAARGTITAFVEPFRVGSPLPDMPLFLQPGHYVPVPLEATYLSAWSGVPQRWRRVIEA